MKGNRRSNVVVPKSGGKADGVFKPKLSKPANMTGSQPSMYSKGHFGKSGNGLKK